MGEGTRRAGRTARCHERGSGLLSAVLGVGVVMALVGLASNVALGLWTRSTVDSIAYDAARAVATAPAGVDPVQARQRAIERARELLGPHGRRVDLRFEPDPAADVVVLRVRTPGVSLLPRMLGSGPVVGGLDRRIVLVAESAERIE